MHEYPKYLPGSETVSGLPEEVMNADDEAAKRKNSVVSPEASASAEPAEPAAPSEPVESVFPAGDPVDVEDAGKTAKHPKKKGR